MRFGLLINQNKAASLPEQAALAVAAGKSAPTQQHAAAPTKLPDNDTAPGILRSATATTAAAAWRAARRGRPVHLRTSLGAAPWPSRRHHHHHLQHRLSPMRSPSSRRRRRPETPARAAAAAHAATGQPWDRPPGSPQTLLPDAAAGPPPGPPLSARTPGGPGIPGHRPPAAAQRTRGRHRCRARRRNRLQYRSRELCPFSLATTPSRPVDEDAAVHDARTELDAYDAVAKGRARTRQRVHLIIRAPDASERRRATTPGPAVADAVACRRDGEVGLREWRCFAAMSPRSRRRRPS